MAAKKMRLYPEIKISLIKKPSRFYAIPLVGFLVKIIMVIPVCLYLCILNIAAFFVWIINSFYILFTGNYWSVAYVLNVGIIRLGAKVVFFLYGLTDNYPGFSFTIGDAFSIAMPYPKKPNRWFAIPLFGFIARLVLLLPYLIYDTVIKRAAMMALVVGSFFVVFTGKYPESDYELNRDSFRISQATVMWFTGLSDAYPSFWISMNHSVIKIILIILSAATILFGYSTDFTHHGSSRSMYQQSFDNSGYPAQQMYYNQK